MIRTYVLPCRLVRADADALNRESGRLYSSVLVQHWRIYHKHGLWLSPSADEKLSDFLTAADPPLLHAHSKDAAQQAFARACKTTRSLRAQGLTANFPHKRKYYRTTIWKNTAIRLRTCSPAAPAILLLSRARGLAPISVDLPSSLAAMPRHAFVEARLVYERCSSCYQWHLVVDDGQLPLPPPPLPPPPPGAATVTVAVDMGEIHPAALTDGQTSLIISCRELRAARQYTAKRLSQLRSLMDRGRTHKGSRNWLRLKRRQLRFRAQQRRRINGGASATWSTKYRGRWLITRTLLGLAPSPSATCAILPTKARLARGRTSATRCGHMGGYAGTRLHQLQSSGAGDERGAGG